MAKHELNPLPPRWADFILRWICPADLQEELQGDLHEQFIVDSAQLGEPAARRRYMIEVLKFCRPYFLKRKLSSSSKTLQYPSSFFANPEMIHNYFKIAWRNVISHKGYSAIHIFGLAFSMTVAILVGIWVHDETSFNKSHQNYAQIAQVWQHATINGQRLSLPYNPYHLAELIRNNYGSDFDHVQMATFTSDHILSYKSNKFVRKGSFMESEVPDMLTLTMVYGSQAALKDPYSVLLSKSCAAALFGDIDPVGKSLRLDNNLDVTIGGVYQDIARNSDFQDLSFIAPWELYLISQPLVKKLPNPWNYNNFQTLVQLKNSANVALVSEKIRNLRRDHMPQESANLFKPEVFLHPMNKWHLYSQFQNGINTGGQIQYVWLFSIIGGFVLLLACINFTNLSTARAQLRAKEVGIRKVVGSMRGQLIGQFLSESLLIAFFALLLAVAFTILTLPFFNEITGKNISLQWKSPALWLSCTAFTLFTGLLAGSYPALYLSSFKPVKVLKGRFVSGRRGAVPRKAFVVIQLTVSVTLVIGTLIVLQQVKQAKTRELGYMQSGLVSFPLSPETEKSFEAIRSEMKQAGAISEMTASANPINDYYVSDNQFEWNGKDPGLSLEFPVNNVTPEYGKTIGWQIKSGRDFSRSFSSDSSAFIINEAAADFMGLKNPLGETIKWRSKPYKVIGVIKDIVFESPYSKVSPYIYHMSAKSNSVVTVRINSELGMAEAVRKIELVFKQFNPDLLFNYQFIDQQYAKKFIAEERIGKLAAVFTCLAIFISGLGLFGLSSFVAEQRRKEVGIRKVLGASIINVWGLLSKEFLVLVMIAILISIPVSFYLLDGWLNKYEYRTELSWWIFTASGLGALLITLLTVSYQAISAALIDPVKTLKSE